MATKAPLVVAGKAALVKEDPEKEIERAPGQAVQRWAKGEKTLMQLKGYSEDELYSIAQQGYTLFLNGKIKDAQTIFEGLTAVDPRNDYYYRALGVVYHRLGDAEKAIKQFTHAVTVAPKQPTAYVNRAEVHIARRDYEKALTDLDYAIRVAVDLSAPIARKALALRSLIRRQR
jgi:type III secretion system low calcium response chaperone LcrH/SycD